MKKFLITLLRGVREVAKQRDDEPAVTAKQCNAIWQNILRVVAIYLDRAAAAKGKIVAWSNTFGDWEVPNGLERLATPGKLSFYQFLNVP